MNKLKLLVTASLLVGGGIFALSAADGVTSAKAAEADKTYTYDFTNFTFDVNGEWSSSYETHTVLSSTLGNNLPNSRFVFESANKQNEDQLIYDIPVTKGQDVTFILEEDGFKIESFTFKCRQWGSKTQTIEASYSTDGTNFFTIPNLSSNNFILESSDISIYDSTALLFSFSSAKNQIGIESLTITLQEQKEVTGEDYFDSSTTSTSLKLSGYSNGVFNENIVFNNIDFGEDKKTKYSPNEMVDAMGLDPSVWSISGTDVELLMYNGYTGEIQFYKDGYIEITNNESKINSFTLTGLTLSFSKNLIVVDENNNEVKGTENGDGTTFKFSGDGTRKFKITLTGRDSLYATGSMQLYCKGSATITGAGIRFGTNIPVNLYDENADYGVIVAQASSLDAALDSYLGLESDISLDGFKHDLETMEVKYYDSGKLIPAYVMNINDTEAATPEEANYVQYALVLNGLENLLNEEFAAVCYMTSSDGTFHIMSEARHSVRSVAEAYLADDKIMSSLTNNSIALLNAVVA